MNQDTTLENDAPKADTAPLTPQEREFIMQALAKGLNLQGNFENLVPTMNMIESIIRKMSTGVA